MGMRARPRGRHAAHRRGMESRGVRLRRLTPLQPVDGSVPTSDFIMPPYHSCVTARYRTLYVCTRSKQFRVALAYVLTSYCTTSLWPAPPPLLDGYDHAYSGNVGSVSFIHIPIRLRPFLPPGTATDLTHRSPLSPSMKL